MFKITDRQNKPNIKKIKTGLSKDNNIEGLCYDPVIKQLLISCKDHSGTGEDSPKAVYSFDIHKAQLNENPFMVIHPRDFKAITGNNVSSNPSAIAVYPITHDIYILSTRDNKSLAVFSHESVLKTYQTIDKKMMEQPKGICFNPQGN